MKSRIIQLLIAAIIFIASSVSANAQSMPDLIVLRTDQYIECTVINVGEDFIHYMNGEKEEKISVEHVKTILYANGTEKVIFKEPAINFDEQVTLQNESYSPQSSVVSTATYRGSGTTVKKGNGKEHNTPVPQYISVRPYNPAFCGVMSAAIPGGGMFMLDENRKAWSYFGATLALATLTGVFSGLAIEAYDYETAMTMSILGGVSATALLTVDIVSIVDAVKTAKRKNRMYQDVWEKRK